MLLHLQQQSCILMSGNFFRFLLFSLPIHLSTASSSAVIGIRTEDSVILSTPRVRISSTGSMVLDNDYDGISPLSEYVAIAVSGVSSDADELETVVKRSCSRYQQMHSSVLTPKSAATLCRNIISSRLRSSRPFSVGTLIGGWDSVSNKPELYWLDNLGTMHEMGFAAHGADVDLILGHLDSRWKPANYSEQDGIDATDTCWSVVGSRSVTKTGGCCAKSVSRAGIRRVWAKRTPPPL